LKKPFTNELLIQTIEEYKAIYDELERLDVDVNTARPAKFSYEELSSILRILKLKKGKKRF
jgi:hypothetical protein